MILFVLQVQFKYFSKYILYPECMQIQMREIFFVVGWTIDHQDQGVEGNTGRGCIGDSERRVVIIKLIVKRGWVDGVAGGNFVALMTLISDSKNVDVF